MICLELFLGFLKVGCFSFGGAYAAIPLIRDVVLSYGWIDEEMLTYMIAVSESTPGPIMINLATYVGTRQAGVVGALIATTAVALPAFLIVVLITSAMEKALRNRFVQAALGGLKPAMIGIILGVGSWMILQNVLIRDAVQTGTQPLKIDGIAVAMTAVLGLCYFGSRRVRRKGISPILLIGISAVLGIAVYGLGKT